MSEDYFTDQRNKDILKAYEKAIKFYGEEAKHLPRNIIIEKAMEFAPRFYITYEIARRNISNMISSGRLSVKNDLKSEMYQEIFRRFKQSKRGKYTSYSGLEKIINSKAPSFYISKYRFARIINEQIKTQP